MSIGRHRMRRIDNRRICLGKCSRIDENMNVKAWVEDEVIWASLLVPHSRDGSCSVSKWKKRECTAERLFLCFAFHKLYKNYVRATWLRPATWNKYWRKRKTESIGLIKGEELHPFPNLLPHGTDNTGEIFAWMNPVSNPQPCILFYSAIFILIGFLFQAHASHLHVKTNNLFISSQ